MLTAEQLRLIDEAVRRVAATGFGIVAIVIERGRVTRLQQQTDVRLDRPGTAGSTDRL